jgi:HD superfamily phosphohydrolase
VRRRRGRPAFWKQVLSDTIDADLLDYLRRDAYYTGLELRYDSRSSTTSASTRRASGLYVDCEKEGMLREAIMSELMRVLETRYHFSERVYYHHAKIAAGALARAHGRARAARRGHRQAGPLLATDESLLGMLEDCDSARPARTSACGASSRASAAARCRSACSCCRST